ncbi:hypothetical protein Y032_0140g2175 [Ancylostoma ceylanicum]|uniref:Uncharacterized protein n=1 Tax=Ancylostoma ceylanicum TaxID=53326 RepID=A0A016T4H7_9BILA|nr:hypothetical protein Y032_0140g2175 [Ancylostoma ceylanicum]
MAAEPLSQQTHCRNESTAQTSQDKKMSSTRRSDVQHLSRQRSKTYLPGAEPTDHRLIVEKRQAAILLKRRDAGKRHEFRPKPVTAAS